MRLILPLLVLACLSCTRQTEQPVLTKVKPNRIVLIFQEPVENGFFKNPETGKRSFGRTTQGDEVQIIDDHYMEQRLSFTIGAASDTVVIRTTRDVLEVNLMYKGIDDLTYLFENGDSVRFRYDGIKPIALVINREESQTVTNYSLFIRDSLISEDFLALKKLQNPLLKLDELEASGLPFEAYMKKVEDEASEQLIREYRLEYDLLDSLRTAGTLNDQQYQFRLQNMFRGIQTSQLSIQTYSKRESNNTLSNINKAINEFKDRYPGISFDRNDSLLFTTSYRQYLATSVATQLKGKVKMLSREGRGSGARVQDQLQRYDSIRATEYMSELEKKISQYQTINTMLSQPGFFSIMDRLKYLNRFKNDFEDSIMVQQLIAKYNIEFKIEDDILLESLSGESMSLVELIAQHKGKVIYLDYWASWCGPCIREMPHSKQFQSAMDNASIVYLYVSSDRSANAWKKSIDKHKLEQGLHYRITNANTSKGLEDLQIMFIPRYMIYDKDGQLVNKDAFRPSESDALKAELAKYL